MQSNLLLVGPFPTTATIDASSSSFSFSFSSSFTITGCNSFTGNWSYLHNRHNKCCHNQQNKRVTTVVFASSSSSSAAINGEQDHYAVLGLDRNATSADIKKAYRLLARKHHPDVSKNSQAGELFKSIRHAYEILSNDVTRTQYDQIRRFEKDTGRSYGGRQYYSSEVEDWTRTYRWAEMSRKMRSERFWDHYNASEDSSSYSDAEEEAEEGNLDHDRGPFSEVLRSVFMSLFLLYAFGSLLSLTYISLMALFDRQLDAGYKIGYMIAWILGGRGGILLTLLLQFASWVGGKTSSSTVALVVVAMWIGSHLARFAPLPQGALLTLLYMSIRLQADLK